MEKQEYFHMYEEEGRHWWYVGMRSIVLSLLPPASLPKNPLTLDAGCGAGFNMQWLRRHYGAAVIGFDYSPDSMDFCRRRGERCLARADAASLPFSENAFDLVVSFDVLTQLRDDSARRSALAEFLRALKPGGLLLIRVAAYERLRSSHDAVIMTYHRYGREELRQSAMDAGFRVLRLTSANTILFPVAAAWRILKKAKLATPGSDVRPMTRGGDEINRILASALKLEAAVLRRNRIDFGFGLSIFLLAAKPGGQP